MSRQTMALVLALVSAVLQHVPAGRTTLGDPPAVYNVVLPRASSSPLHVAVRNTLPVLMLKTDDEVHAPPSDVRCGAGRLLRQRE